MKYFIWMFGRVIIRFCVRRIIDDRFQMNELMPWDIECMETGSYKA